MYLALRKNFQTKSRRGFSLGEVLLAGFVLTTGLLATSALMVKSLKNSFETRDTIIAVELAQEGVELVRNVRDNDFADGGDGFDANDGFAEGLKHCHMSYDDSNMITNCYGPGDGNAPNNRPDRYYLEYASGMYKHTGNKGKFSRYVYINFNNTKKEAVVKSFVYWGNGVPTGIESGNTANCIVAKKCVYTEIFLNSWYTPPTP